MKWWLGAVLLLGAAAGLSLWQRQELLRAVSLLSQAGVAQVSVAVGLQSLSLVCFAVVPHGLLRSGGARLRLRHLVAMAVAGNAVAGALPGGAAFATAWMFRQLTRRHVSAALTVTALMLSGVLSFLALALLLVTGIGVTGTLGTLGFLLPAVAVTVLAVGSCVTVVLVWRSAHFRAAVLRLARRATRRSPRLLRAQAALDQVISQAASLRQTARSWSVQASAAVLNWLCDAACLAACLWALGIAVPWAGLLLAYSFTQVPGSLRLTPGSLGVVEVSLSALLVLHGLSAGQAIAGTLLYRMVSYWALQPIGWGCWFGVSFLGTGRRRLTWRGPG
ncbi:lysylphosphatidylglycerol synthase transmembrane domain-containing protein [Streptomyces sp. TR02-1]|uniref:lysylphosphatidylglycerol synthase transmembrane domain-containing protein n=1 Tax=Streptomyces sp. TR02-1 TaxID=3385977 RepID=UPI0039A2CAEB